MIPSWIELIAQPLIAAVVGVVSYRITEKYSKRNTLNKERLVNLLQPLYLVFIELDTLLAASNSSVNYSIIEYYDDLPETRKKVLPILRSNLYLASEEMSHAGLEFLLWAEVESQNKSRFNAVMFGKQDDKPFAKLRDLVIAEFNDEKSKYHK